ncbi:hypothetical protein MMC18_009612 [Xylographa bjoerkii]|nr:hypothetical protein [Xylographa bjoerkii]
MTQTIVEASIADLQTALSVGSITSVDLVLKHLHRIAAYDFRGPCLNSIPILNPSVLDEAAASDARRAAGHLRGPLDGIPYTLKDSMKYKGMTCSNGSPALIDVVADEDCFVADRLRNAGAICVGRTNTPPMMASGMHRGVHGRAESPYNLDYLTAAFSSGSSNGSGTSTAASFAAFSLGSETVSSGRSPASNNALVAYTPSRTMISLRGIWPLYGTCDVLVPHTRSVQDMLTILDVLTVEDTRTNGDFWREQTYVDVPTIRRPQSFLDMKQTYKGSLHGKRLAVPAVYVGGHTPGAKPTVVSQDVIDLWKKAKSDLEALGATVIETDFPLVMNYENDAVSGQAINVVGLTSDWHLKERGELVAYAWDDFLKSNRDPKYPGLGSVDGAQIFPRPDNYPPDRYLDQKNFLNYPGLVEMARNRPAGKSVWDVDGIAEALSALEEQRKRDLEDWMDEQGIDIVVFPANGDVGRADLEVNEESAKHALQIGVKFSNGNRAIRHLGVPTVSVPMGIMQRSRMPVNLTFAGKHGQDADLLRYAYDFEQHGRRRIAPPVTPALATDEINPSKDHKPGRGVSTLNLEITSAGRVGATAVEVKGQVHGSADESVVLEAYVDGTAVPAPTIHMEDGQWTLRAPFKPFEPPTPPCGGVGQVVGNVLVVVLARAADRVVGKTVLIDQKAAIQT